MADGEAVFGNSRNGCGGYLRNLLIGWWLSWSLIAKVFHQLVNRLGCCGDIYPGVCWKVFVDYAGARSLNSKSLFGIFHLRITPSALLP